MRYEELGFRTFEEYFDYFLKTLLPTNRTYEFFVDWGKVKGVVEAHAEGIALLNSLRFIKDGEERKKKLADILLRYPTAVAVIPLIIAERLRSGRIEILDSENLDIVEYDFSIQHLSKEEANKLVVFCDKTGIIDLLGDVKDLHDYLLGVEVGIDTNARKNRSGVIFENLVEAKMRKSLPENIRIIKNDPRVSIYPIVKKKKGIAKKHDFVFYRGSSPIAVAEANFYSASGSKPISIAGEYVAMSQAAREIGLMFIWVTDGRGWLEMQEPLARAMREMDWVINLKMVERITTILRTT